MKSLKLTIHISLGFTKTQREGEQIPSHFLENGILTELRPVQNIAACASCITQKSFMLSPSVNNIICNIVYCAYSELRGTKTFTQFQITHPLHFQT